ncbi:uncharacterized protein LOC132903823 [Amyelois transitella]|uniref:uncharacterized protein LOC132903823 n=1 Tax=Amyelois transitella TaxID=680683 RepID=UPI00298F7899|nr:uncharacterized protein LOC132903823 [Amyelois transitella]
MDNINVEDFINEIEIRPAIWNSKSDKHSNRTETKNAWEGICEKFVEDFKNKTTGEKNSAAMVLQKKWRHIRDSFSRELKKQRESKSGSAAKRHRQYVYFDRLQFLSELYETKPDEKNKQTGDGATASTPKTTTKSSSANDTNETNTLLKILAERLQNKKDAREQADIEQDKVDERQVQDDGINTDTESDLSFIKPPPSKKKKSTDDKIAIFDVIMKADSGYYDYQPNMQVSTQGYTTYSQSASTSRPHSQETLVSSDIFESTEPVNGTVSARIEYAQIARRAHALYEPCMSCAKAAQRTIAVTACVQRECSSRTVRELHIRGTFARCGRTPREDVSEDGDRYFLLSLLNDFKRIPESRKMDAKYDIIGIIRKYAMPQSYTRDYYNLDSESGSTARYNLRHGKRAAAVRQETHKLKAPLERIQTNGMVSTAGYHRSRRRVGGSSQYVDGCRR